MGIKIISTGSYLPKKIISNFDLEKIFDTSDEWISKRTGIKERHFCSEDENTSNIAIKAVENAINNYSLYQNQNYKKNQINYKISTENENQSKNIINLKSKIKLIITASFTPDYVMPNLSSLIHAYLKLDEKVLGFDINMACSGFSAAIKMADSILNEHEYAILIGAETISKHLDMNNRSTSILFGDGAGCIILEKTNSTCYYDYGILNNYEHLIMKNNDYINMNGPEVFKFATKQVVKTIKELTKKANLELDKINHFVLHQANQRILDSVAKKLDICNEKFYSNLKYYGNTSAASIAIAFDEMNKKNLLKKGDKIIFVGYGAGLIYCSVLFEF